MMGFASEAELARLVVAWLADQRYEVYQEVQIARGGRVADIVATQGAVTVVVETKRSMTWRLLNQAYAWKPWACLVYCAVPHARGFGYPAEKVALHALGLGILSVEPGGVVREAFPAIFGRPNLHFHNLRAHLREEHKTQVAAGTAGGGYWTPFKRTCNNLREYVGAHPGCSMKEAVTSIDHHYRKPATAKAALCQWLRKGVIDGIESRDGGLYLSAKET